MSQNNVVYVSLPVTLEKLCKLLEVFALPNIDSHATRQQAAFLASFVSRLVYVLSHSVFEYATEAQNTVFGTPLIVVPCPSHSMSTDSLSHKVCLHAVSGW